MFPQPSTPVDLNAYHLQEVLRILDLHVPGIEVWAFGSRAKWTAKAYSDLDLALITQHPLSLEEEAKLREAFDESTLPIRVDFVDWSTISESFRKIVSRDKVVIRRVEAVNADQVSWPVIPLEVALDSLIDYRGKTPEKTTSGIPLITAKVIKAGRIEPPTEFISPDNYDQWMTRGFPKVGDVVLTTEAPLGEVAQLNSARVALAQRVILLRGKSGMLDNTYLRYLLQTSDMQEQLASRATGTTVLGIKQSELRQISIRIPPLEMQRRAADLLAHLDDRIALLRETNATLEAIARALFKSWFVDFDPVYAKQQGIAPAGMDDATAALFPDNLEKWVQLIERPTAETLIGKRVLMIGDGYRAKNSELGIPGVPFVRGGDLLQGRITPTKDFLAMTALSGARGKAAKSGDTAFTSKGAIGRFAFVDASAGEAVYSPQVCFWRSLNQDHLDPIYLHFWMKSLAFTSQVAAVCGQAAIMDFVSLSDQRKMILDIPINALQARFANVVKPLLERISINRATDECLSELRDTLLPRLISGQLRLPQETADQVEALHAL